MPGGVGVAKPSKVLFNVPRFLILYLRLGDECCQRMVEQYPKPGATVKTPVFLRTNLCNQGVLGFSTFSLFFKSTCNKKMTGMSQTDGTKHFLNFQCDCHDISIHQGKRCTRNASSNMCSGLQFLILGLLFQLHFFFMRLI